MEIVSVILEQVAIWAPSLASILGIVGTIIACISQLHKEVDRLRGEDYQAQLQASNDALRAQIQAQSDETQKALRDITEQTKAVINENLSLKKANRLLIEDLRKVREHNNDDKI